MADRDVFATMRATELQLAEITARASRMIVYPVTRDEALWLCERLAAVFGAVQNADVTYSTFGEEDGEVTSTPMATERDALVWALADGMGDWRMEGATDSWLSSVRGASVAAAGSEKGETT